MLVGDGWRSHLVHQGVLVVDLQVDHAKSGTSLPSAEHCAVDRESRRIAIRIQFSELQMSLWSNVVKLAKLIAISSRTFNWIPLRGKRSHVHDVLLADQERNREVEVQDLCGGRLVFVAVVDGEFGFSTSWRQ